MFMHTNTTCGSKQMLAPSRLPSGVYPIHKETHYLDCGGWSGTGCEENGIPRPTREGFVALYPRGLCPTGH